MISLPALAIGGSFVVATGQRAIDQKSGLLPATGDATTGHLKTGALDAI